MSATSRSASYTPARTPAEWAQIEPMVRRLAEPFAVDRHPLIAKQGFLAIMHYLAWAVRTGAAPLDDRALNPALFDYYCARRSEVVKSTTAQRERKLLRQIAGHRLVVETARPTTDADGERPYTPAQLGELRNWASLNPEPRRASLRGALALAAGCGLTAFEMMAVRTSDVFTDIDGHLSVSVPIAEPRQVPVLADWEPTLRRAIEGRNADEFLVAPTSVTRGAPSLKWLFKLAQGTEFPSAQRLRATWLVRHLEAGTPIATLLDAAGLTSTDSLKRAIIHVQRQSDVQRLASLRATSSEESS